MPKNNNHNKGRQATSVTPQGDTGFSDEPKTKLEEAAKKKNTK